MDFATQLVPFALIIGAFYLLIIRPSRNRQRAQQRLGDQLAVGARVMTTSGLFAVVAGVEDDGILLEVAPGVTMRWTKAAVARILPEPEPEDGSGDDEDADDADVTAETDDAVDPAETDDAVDPADPAPDQESTERPT